MSRRMRAHGTYRNLIVFFTSRRVRAQGTYRNFNSFLHVEERELRELIGISIVSFMSRRVTIVDDLSMHIWAI